MLITEDGLYLATSGSQSVFISGSGAGTMKFVYKNSEGASVDITDGVVVLGEQYTLNSSRTPIFLSVTGTDGGTAIVMDVR